MSQIELLARSMYAERCAERGPRWDQLGDVTRSVWMDYARAALYGDLA